MEYAEKQTDSFLLRLRNRRHTFWRLAAYVVGIFLAGVVTGVLSR